MTSEKQDTAKDPQAQLREKENARAMIKVLTGKEHVWFTRRGNRAIIIAMRVIKNLNTSNVIIQEEGGWLTYESSIEKAGLNPIRITTDDGIINEQDLPFHDHDSALLINSMAGYIALHDMDNISGLCMTNNQMLVNDASGSIGTDAAKVGDIVLGSFGDGKPMNLHTGGFIASNDEEIVASLKEEVDEEPDINYVILSRKLKGLESRRKYLLSTASKVKEDLSEYQIAHQNHEGLNVVVRYSDQKEKDDIITYCKNNNFEYTECPREIRIMDDAISIEIKRLDEDGETSEKESEKET